jgi:hypothetical protein
MLVTMAKSDKKLRQMIPARQVKKLINDQAEWT